MLTQCPSTERLEALMRSPQSGAPLHQHLQDCPTCKGRLEDLQRNNQLLRELQEGKPLRSSNPALEAQAVDGYELLHVIHRGGQGVVYRAIQRSTQRTVALKVLLGGALATPQKKRRFEREIEVVASLRHPHIVTVFEGGIRADGCPFYTMELIQGVTYGRFDHGTQDQTLLRFATLCNAIHYAHQRGVIHRDLKPANILVDEQGEPHVVDFGLARPTELPNEESLAADHLTTTGEFMGTLAYASPEQVAGEALDVRTDVYSLGVILYEILTGHSPYPSALHMKQMVEAITEAKPQPPEVNAELDAVLLRALAKAPDQRYQSALDLANELRRYLAGEPLDARRDRRWYLFRKTVRRHRLAFSVVAAFVLVLAFSTALFWQLWRRAEDSAEREAFAARRALASQEFLQNMLHSAELCESRGRQVLVQEVLEVASRDLERELAHDPLLRADLHQTIGMTFDSLGLHEQSHEHLEHCVALRREHLGGDHPDLAAALRLLGHGCGQEGDLREALQYLDESLSILDRLSPEATATRARVLRSKATVLLRMDRFEQAEPLFLLAIDLQRGLGAAGQGDLAVSLGQLGFLLARKGRSDQALSFLREGIQLRRQLGDRQHLRNLATDLVNLADVLSGRGPNPQVRESLAEAAAIFEELLGPDNLSLLLCRIKTAVWESQEEDRESARDRLESLSTHRHRLVTEDSRYSALGLHALGTLAEIAGQPGVAEGYYRDALAVFEQVFQSSHPERAVMLASLSWVLRSQGQSSAAEKLSRKAVQSLRRHLGGRNIHLAQTLVQLSWILTDLGMEQEAENLARQALDLFASFESAASVTPAYARAKQTLGYRCLELGKAEEAEALLRAALAIQEKLWGPAHVDSLGSMHGLGLALLRLGQPEEAEQLHRDALDLHRELTAEQTLILAHLNSGLGFIELSKSRFDAADQCFSLSVDIYERLVGRQSVHFIRGLSGKASCDWSRGHRDVGHRLFDEALELAQQHLPADHPLLASCLYNKAIACNTDRDTTTSLPLLERSYAIYRDKRGLADLETVKVRTELVQTYRAVGNLEAAESLSDGP